MNLSPPTLHSRYNPEKEASRFVDSLNPGYIPHCILVTEPGESYIHSYLRKKFPHSTLVAARYQNDLYHESDILWDSVYRPGMPQSFSQFLSSITGDMDISYCLFVTWKPSDSAWPDTARELWRSIASFIQLQQSVMYTRATFGKKWLSNSIMNSVMAENIVQVRQDILSDVLVLASGPSGELNSSLLRMDLPLVSVTSSTLFLNSLGIIPSLYITTDGGYWAGRYLDDIPAMAPLAFPVEAALPRKVLSDNPCLLLDYGSAFEKFLFSTFRVPVLPLERNATVGGSSVLLAGTITRGHIFTIGLDLCPSKGYPHARPHFQASAVLDSADRIQSVGLKSYAMNSDSRSIHAYANWFEDHAHLLAKKMTRIEGAQRKLAGFTDISAEDARRRIQSIKDTQKKQAESSLIKQSASVFLSTQDRRMTMIDFLHEKAELLDRAAVSAKKGKISAAIHLEETINSDPILHEILQFSSYTGLLQFNKKKRSQISAEDLQSTVEGIIKECTLTIEKILMRMTVSLP